MQVSDANNVKVYNLSAGKSLPEWLSDKKKRQLQKKHVDIRRRIELIQDFDMPALSTTVNMSPDGQYILATGIYKPRVKCFDVNNLAMKFERCFDSEVVTFEILSEDYSKVVFLHCDRYLEFHAAYGRYYRVRIPKFGRGMQYHQPSCDLFIVGASPEIYRLNLERGQFLNSFVTQASEINVCCINPVHYLLACGTKEGRVEAWDPRTRKSVGVLDCALNSVTENTNVEGFPSVTSINFQGGLTLGVGTATGQILLFDIRSNKPFYVKDHMYGLPVTDIHFHEAQNLVFSMDSSAVKIWDRDNGKPYASIESSDDLNNLCVVPDTGLLFIANEGQKVLTYYIPSIGPAPKWCSFLDNLTEELEESNTQTVYDDYKFVTKRDLEDLGMAHLLGTNLLRAYMHGYFMDIRLYRKAKSLADPFAFEEYRKRKIREKIEGDRVNRVTLKKMPKVNKELALKLMDNDMKPKNKNAPSLLQDDRFKSLFQNPDFEIDKTAEEYRLLNPVVSKLDKNRKKELEKQVLQQQFEQVEDEVEGEPSAAESSDFDSSSDDDRELVSELKRQHKLLQQENKARSRQMEFAEATTTPSQPRFFELRAGEEFQGLHGSKKKNKLSLGERVQQEAAANTVKRLVSSGSREMTFSLKKAKEESRALEASKRHREERKKVMRPAFGLHSKKSNFF